MIHNLRYEKRKDKLRLVRLESGVFDFYHLKLINNV